MRKSAISPNESILSAEEVKRLKSSKEQVSRYAEEVMQLGNKHRYRELQVNGALVIGAGPEGWRAYADRAVEKRVGEIERAIEREVQ